MNPTNYDARVVTRHAAEQAMSRNISMREIADTVCNYDLKTASQTESKHRTLYWKKVAGRVLVAVVGTNPKFPRQVVSVYDADRPKQAAYRRMMAAA